MGCIRAYPHVKGDCIIKAMLFAEEMTSQRDLSTVADTSLAAFVTNVLPTNTSSSSNSPSHGNGKENGKQNGDSAKITHANGSSKQENSITHVSFFSTSNIFSKIS